MIMKKLLVSMFALLLMSVVVVQAQEATKVKSEVAKQDAVTAQDEKVEIKATELPEAVQASLKGEAYIGWTIDKAHHIKSKGHYEVTLKSGMESKKVIFDKEGKEVRKD
jgi:ribosomal protein S8